jgi:exodeoxyribonuclease VII large subunit
MLNPTGKPFTVTEITQKIKNLLEGSVGTVQITGELSNIRPPSANGHLYFTIKDAGAQIGAVMFASNLRALSFKPENGLKVDATGEISVYAQRGVYQIVVRKMTPVGQGDLMARFEEMKRKLQAEGLFDEAHKRPLPFLPRHIGIVTAPTGAAIRDMITVLSRRFPNLDILIAPAKVQGVGAAEEIAQGIRDLNDVGNPGGLLPDLPRREIIIVGRGGGSLEDLWSFNEEVVARAVYNSAIPIISAVGHEIDFTISDFAADKRAPTPSAAAEIVINPKSDLLGGIEVLADRLDKALDRVVVDSRNRLSAAKNHRVFVEPSHAVEHFSQHIDYLSARAVSALEGSLTDAKQRFADARSALEIERSRRLPELKASIAALSDRASRALEKALEARKREIDAASRQLNALSPVAVLERGYSITLLDNGKALRDPAEAPAGTRLKTLLSAGKSVTSFVGDRPPTKRQKKSAGGDAQQLDLFGGFAK